MEGKIVVTCPHCGFNRSVSPSVIPQGTTRASCPKCRQSFALSLETIAPQTEPAPPPAGMVPPTEPPAADADAPMKPPPARPRTLTFSFHGTAGEYFGIWIVNTLLKLVTLGIYTAWAKVRQRRFFYGNTMLYGEPFEYVADPLVLFKGWLIGAAAFVLYMIGSRVSPMLSMIIGVAVFLAIPWLVVRSRMFNTRNSSYRNIRFSFRPEYRQAYAVFAWLPLLTPFTLGLLSPYVLYRQRKFLVENCSYGATPFAFTATARDFYRLFGKVILVLLAFAAIGASLAFFLGGNELTGAARTVGGAKGKLGAIALIPIIFFMLIYFFLGTYIHTALVNLTWNATTARDSFFRSTLRTRDMAWLYLSNALAIVCSIGLLIPWATVRLARYRFERLSLATAGGLDGFLAAAQTMEIGAAGEEIGDIFGISVDVGL